MKMSQLDRQTLTTTLDHLEEMTRTGTIDPQWFYKALVDGAYQYLLTKDLNEVLVLLGKVPAEYYAGDIKTHMEADPAYAEQVFDIAMVLVTNNLVHVGLSEVEKTTVADA